MNSKYCFQFKFNTAVFWVELNLLLYLVLVLGWKSWFLLTLTLYIWYFIIPITKQYYFYYEQIVLHFFLQFSLSSGCITFWKCKVKILYLNNTYNHFLSVVIQPTWHVLELLVSVCFQVLGISLFFFIQIITI